MLAASSILAFVMLCNMISVVQSQVSLETKLDWTAYTVYDHFQDLNRSTNLIMNLPIFQYWDTERAEYEVGPIASELSSSLFADFVYKMDKKTFVDGIVDVQENVSMVDTDGLMWHMIASLQNIYKVKLEHSILVAKLIEEKHDFAKKIVRVAEDTGKEWRTASEMRATVDIIDARIVQFNSLLEKETDRSSWRKENRLYRSEQRKLLRLNHNANMTADLEENAKVTLALHRNKSYSMFDVFVESMHLDKLLELRDYENDFNTSKAMLLKANNMSIDNVIFRVQEETKMERENEKVFVNLAIAKTKSAESQMEALVEVVFEEVITYGSAALQNPVDVLSWSAALCAVLLAVTFLYEIAIVLKFYLIKKFGRNTVTQMPALGEKKTDPQAIFSKRPQSMANNATELACVHSNDIVVYQTISKALENIVLLPACMTPLRQYLSCFLAVLGDASSQALLPNALFTGPTGIGKSLTAAAISQLLSSKGSGKSYCKFDVITVCGADMLALGIGAAGAYLRELFLQSGSDKNSFRKTLIIIDEADLMIGRRSKPATTDTRNNCSPVKGGGTPTKKLFAGKKSTGPDISASNNGDAQDASFVRASSVNAAASDGSCLYQILCACRVNNPNLAVLLTTSQPVSGIDAAVLDRMDYIIEYNNPTAILCVHYLLQCIFELLFVYMGSDTDSESNSSTRPENYSAAQHVLLQLMEFDAAVYDRMLREASATTKKAIKDTSEVVEVLAVPQVNAQKNKSGGQVKAMRNLKAPSSKTRPSVKITAGSDWDGWNDYCSSMKEISDLNNTVGVGSDPFFDTVGNIITLVESMPVSTITTTSTTTTGQLWSYREILKFVRNIQCDILGTDSCRLTDSKWHQVLEVTIQNKTRSANSSWS